MDDDQLTATRLRLALDREVAKHQWSPGAWPRLERRLRRQPWRRAAIGAACALIAAAAATVTPYLWHNLSGPITSHPHPQPGPHLVIGVRTPVSSVGPLTTGYGAVWIIGAGVIYRVDPATARTVATIPAPGTSSKGSQIATGAGAVWATSNGGHTGVYRIDPRASRVSGPPIRVGLGPGLIVPGAGTLWVTGMDYVSRINPATGAVANARGGPWGGTDSLGNAKVSRIDAAGAGSLWTIGVNVVQRVDPANGHVTAVIPVPHAWRVIFWRGLAWALTGVAPAGLGTIVGIDPASNRVVVHGIPFRGAPTAIASGPDGLWAVVANPDHTSQQLVHLVLDPGSR